MAPTTSPTAQPLVLTGVTFGADGVTLNMLFNQPTDQAGAVAPAAQNWLPAQCSTVFYEDSLQRMGSGASCRWATPSHFMVQVRRTPPVCVVTGVLIVALLGLAGVCWVQLGTAPSIVPDDIFSLLPEAIQGSSGAYLTENTSPPLHVPPGGVRPTGVLVAPSEVGNCAVFTLDARNSLGLLGRAASFSVTVRYNSTQGLVQHSLTQQVQTSPGVFQLNTQNMSQWLLHPLSDRFVSQTLLFTLHVTNYFGLTSTAVYHTLVVLPRPAPHVTILAPNSVKRASQSVFRAQVSVSSACPSSASGRPSSLCSTRMPCSPGRVCSGAALVFAFQWRLVESTVTLPMLGMQRDGMALSQVVMMTDCLVVQVCSRLLAACWQWTG